MLIEVCSGQNLTRITMMTRVQAIEGFPETCTTLRVHPEASVTSGIPGAVLRPEDISTQKYIPPLRGLHCSNVLTSSGSSPLRDSLRSEGFSFEPEPPTTNHT